MRRANVIVSLPFDREEDPRPPEAGLGGVGSSSSWPLLLRELRFGGFLRFKTSLNLLQKQKINENFNKILIKIEHLHEGDDVFS